MAFGFGHGKQQSQLAKKGVKETTPSAITNALDDAPRFAVGGGTVVIIRPVGGDLDKFGDLLQLMDKGAVDSAQTEEFIDKDTIVLIPTPKTLDAIGDTDMLGDDSSVCLSGRLAVGPDGVGIDLCGPASIGWFRQVASGAADVRSLVSESRARAQGAMANPGDPMTHRFPPLPAARGTRPQGAADAVADASADDDDPEPRFAPEGSGDPDSVVGVDAGTQAVQQQAAQQAAQQAQMRQQQEEAARREAEERARREAEENARREAEERARREAEENARREAKEKATADAAAVADETAPVDDDDIGDYDVDDEPDDDDDDVDDGDVDDGNDDADGDDGNDDGGGDGDYPDDADFGPEATHVATMRQWHDDDRTYSVDLNAFDSTFTDSSLYIDLPARDERDTGSDWLDKQVVRLIDQANAELDALHTGNIGELRELYIALESEDIDNVMASQSSTDPDGVWFAMTRQARANLDSALAAADAGRAQVTKDITAGYEAARERAAAVAAQNARDEFMQSHQAQIDMEVRRTISEAHAAAQARYATDMAHIGEARERRIDARINLGTTQVLKYLMTKRDAQRAAEQKLLGQWHERIATYITDNKDADVERARALADELRRNDSLAAAKRDYDERAKRLNEEWDKRVADLSRALEDSRRSADSRVEDMKRQGEANVAAMSARVATAEQRADSLAQQLEQERQAAGERTERERRAVADEYERRLHDAQMDKEMLSRQLDRSDKDSRRHTGLIVTLAVLLFLVALCAGYIVGAKNGVTGVIVPSAAWTPAAVAAMLP